MCQVPCSGPLTVYSVRSSPSRSLESHVVMASLEPYMSVINDMFMNGVTYHEISEKLLEMGVQQGSSEISIRRLFAQHNMQRKGHTSDSDLEIAVSCAVNEVSLFNIYKRQGKKNETNSYPLPCRTASSMLLSSPKFFNFRIVYAIHSKVIGISSCLHRVPKTLTQSHIMRSIWDTNCT